MFILSDDVVTLDGDGVQAGLGVDVSPDVHPLLTSPLELAGSVAVIDLSQT